jgi:ribonuclease P protein component
VVLFHTPAPFHLLLFQGSEREYEQEKINVLPRQHRLTENRDFKRVFSTGKSHVHRLLILKVRPRPVECPGRWGFSTSAKLGNAVTRNRAKRLVSESVRLLGNQVRESGYDAVLIARPPIRESSMAEVARAVQELLQKAGLIEAEHK